MQVRSAFSVTITLYRLHDWFDVTNKVWFSSAAAQRYLTRELFTYVNDMLCNFKSDADELREILGERIDDWLDADCKLKPEYKQDHGVVEQLAIAFNDYEFTPHCIDWSLEEFKSDQENE